MTNNYELKSVLPLIRNKPWAILPEYLELMADTKCQAIDIEAVSRPRESRNVGNAVAVIPIAGIITQRSSILSDIFGGTGLNELRAMMSKALNSSEVGTILLDVDSPGGSINGIHEMAEFIFQARKQKPIIAIANTTMGSAAFWIGAAASQVFITPSGMAGSIGVIAKHVDDSKQLENEGIVETVISAGKFKAAIVEGHPLEDEGRKEIQSQVDFFFDMFVKDVAKFRGATPAQVKSGFGQGRMLNAPEAVSERLVDGIQDMDSLLDSVFKGNRQAAQIKNKSRARSIDLQQMGV